jgi:3-dehydroquinate dehydratase-2
VLGEAGSARIFAQKGNFTAAMDRILIINGPNLDRLGKREVAIYGERGLEDLMTDLRATFPTVVIEHYQSNIEGELINMIHGADGHCAGIVLNAGGYAHTSVALRDAIASVKVPVVEVHLSNLLTREAFRHSSIIGPACAGSIMGLGADGYRLAVDHLLRRGG